MTSPNTLGVFGYSFLDQNRDKVKASSVDGVMPEMDKISSGEYPVSRSLWFYIKLTHAAVIPGIMEYAKEFISPKAASADGYLVPKGLIPLPEAERMKYQKHVKEKVIFDPSWLKK